MIRKERVYNPATREFYFKEVEVPVHEEVRYYDTPTHSCTLTKNRCCAPLPRDGLRPDGEHDCRSCNVPVLFALIGLRDNLVDIHDEIVLWKAEEKE